MVNERHNADEELLAAHALNALEGEERALAEQLLSADPALHEVWAEYQEVVTRLGELHDEVRPPALLRTRLMTAITMRQQLAVQQRLRRWMMPTIGAAALVLAFVGLGATSMIQHTRVESLETHVAKLEQDVRLAEQNLQAQRDLVYLSVSSERATAVQPVETLVAPVTQTTPPVGPHGMLFVSRYSDEAMLAIINMEPLEEGLVYQVWLWDGEGNAFGLSTFDIDQEGYAMVPMTLPHDLTGIEGLSISVEPGGGSVKPMGEHVLAGDMHLPRR